MMTRNARTCHVPSNYPNAVEALSGGRKKNLGCNTSLSMALMDTQIVWLWHHDTIVAAYHKDLSVSVFTEGHRSMTTKDRINAALPKGWSLYQAKGEWWLYNEALSTPDGRHRVPFREGIALWPNGHHQ